MRNHSGSTVIGVDVSAAWLDVAWPGQQPSRFANDQAGHASLLGCLHATGALAPRPVFACEASGGFEPLSFASRPSRPGPKVSKGPAAFGGVGSGGAKPLPVQPRAS
ncbi:hypothetical protein [Siccirubricoccus phaeus]|uniref:hypothetical protein n=1 Tax=Siccirubricoccus phaeus TaxID=2595053 RepID=UPI0011F309AC|nr:hypothetical protein [Siccirubricoccus phaeus]